MSYTVVGLFADYSQTQRVVERLQAIGIASKHIDVARGRQDGPKNVKDEPEGKQEWVGTDKVNDNNLSRFFKSLFSDRDDEVSEHYTKIANSGHAIVTVQANSQGDAERIADILDEYGAINVNEQAGRGTQTMDRMVSGGSVRDINDERANSIRGSSGNTEQNRLGGESERQRLHSQIFNRSIDENLRLRDEDQRQRGNTDWDQNKPGDSGF